MLVPLFETVKVVVVLMFRSQEHFYSFIASFGLLKIIVQRILLAHQRLRNKTVDSIVVFVDHLLVLFACTTFVVKFD